MVCWIDIRTKAGKARKPMALRHALTLRKRGMCFDEIAPLVGLSPATISMGLWRTGYVHLSPYELADYRYAYENGLDPEEVIAEREREQRLAWLFDREGIRLARRYLQREAQVARERRRAIYELAVECRFMVRRRETAQRRERRQVFHELSVEARAILRRREARLRRERAKARQEANAGRRRVAREVARSHRRLRKKRDRAKRQAEIAFRKNWASPMRLDAPLREYPTLTVGELVPAPAEYDPQVAIEQGELSELLGNLSLEDVEGLNEETLEWLREKLRDAGYAGYGRHIQADERERMMEKEPISGVSGRPERHAIPTEDVEDDLLYRKAGSRKHGKARAQSRKALQNHDQAKFARNRGNRRHDWRGYKSRVRHKNPARLPLPGLTDKSLSP